LECHRIENGHQLRFEVAVNVNLLIFRAIEDVQYREAEFDQLGSTKQQLRIPVCRIVRPRTVRPNCLHIDKAAAVTNRHPFIGEVAASVLCEPSGGQARGVFHEVNDVPLIASRRGRVLHWRRLAQVLIAFFELAATHIAIIHAGIGCSLLKPYPDAPS